MRRNVLASVHCSRNSGDTMSSRGNDLYEVAATVDKGGVYDDGTIAIPVVSYRWPLWGLLGAGVVVVAFFVVVGVARRSSDDGGRNTVLCVMPLNGLNSSASRTTVVVP